MVYKIYKDSLTKLFTLLLVTIEIVVTYDLRDSLACASFYHDEINVTRYQDTQSQDSSYYRFLLIDPEVNRLFVGSMNRITILPLDDISTPKQTIELKPEQQKVDFCKYQKPEFPNCQNHITFITKTRNNTPEYFLCGTNAQSPYGYRLTNGQDNYRTEPVGTAACSDDPFSNITAIHVKESNVDTGIMYYGASSFERSSLYRPIIKQDGTWEEYMKGVFSSKWMKNAQFAGSFNVLDMVFFFFREYAIETENIEPKLYSRVAKVCKRDTGGDSLLRKKWTTYQKARLNCSLPGAFPTYFDSIQDVVTVDGTFYGLFTTNMNGLIASAICAFDRSEIERVFNGPFKHQENDMSYWMEAKANTVPSPRPGQCVNNSMETPDQVLGFIVDHPLMHWTVQQKYQQPLFYLPGEELQTMDADKVGNILTFFLGSNRGKVYKVSSKDTGSKFKSHLASVYHPFDKPEVIWSLKHHDKFVYLGTDQAVIQVNIQNNCVNYSSVDACVYDPYCVWDIPGETCEHKDDRGGNGNYYDFNNFDPATLMDSNEFIYKNGKNSTKKQYGTIKLSLINKYFCTYGRNIVWKKKQNDGSFSKVKLDDDHFLDGKNSLIFDNLDIPDNGVYQAFDVENPDLIAAKYDLEVLTETNMKKVYKAKFDEWCEYFDENRRIHDNYKAKCQLPGGV